MTTSRVTKRSPGAILNMYLMLRSCRASFWYSSFSKGKRDQAQFLFTLCIVFCQPKPIHFSAHFPDGNIDSTAVFGSYEHLHQITGNCKASLSDYKQDGRGGDLHQLAIVSPFQLNIKQEHSPMLEKSRFHNSIFITETSIALVLFHLRIKSFSITARVEELLLETYGNERGI